MHKKNFIIAFLFCSLLGLGACGVKPDNVEPPEGSEDIMFPHTYPDPSTDPKPGLERKSY